MRKKWLPCETPNWSRNASILNTQPCCFTGVLAVRVSQSCIFLFNCARNKTASALGGALKAKGLTAARLGGRGDTRAALSPVPVPTKAAPSSSPSPGGRRGSKGCRQRRGCLVRTAATTCGAETEAGVVKSTCSISRLHRATQSSD